MNYSMKTNDIICIEKDLRIEKYRIKWNYELTKNYGDTIIHLIKNCKVGNFPLL